MFLVLGHIDISDRNVKFRIAIENEFLNLATFLSGVLTIPFGVLVALKGWSMRWA